MAHILETIHSCLMPSNYPGMRFKQVYQPPLCIVFDPLYLIDTSRDAPTDDWHRHILHPHCDKEDTFSKKENRYDT